MSTRTAAGTPRHRRAGLVVTLATAAWLLAGCTSSGDEASDAAAVAEYASSGAPDVVGGAEMAESGAVASEDPEAPGAERSEIVTGSMYMTVEDPTATADQAVTIVVDAGGRVDARSETTSTEYQPGSAWLTLRIPADDLESVVGDLRGLGTVDEFSTSSEDVTRQVTDLDAQISTLRASTARIEGLLQEAEDISDIITLEDELDDRQAELESLEARQRGLEDQVSMSTIELSLTTDPVVSVDDSPESFAGGLESGWNALLGFLSGALVVLGVLLPWIAVGAVIALVVVAALRARRTRSRRAEPGQVASEADASASPPAAPRS